MVGTETRPVVAVHQPNFFPWLGYFHKIRWADTFIILDDVQLPRRSGGSVVNRTELVSNKKRLFVTASIDRSKGSAPQINEVAFATAEDFRERFVKLLASSYSKAPFMKELGDEIIAMIKNPAPLLAEYNGAAIMRIAQLLELDAKMVKSSELGVTTTSTERLVDLVSKVGGKTYLAGSGAKGYQEDELFFGRGLFVQHREYTPPSYPRGKDEPEAGLSILDALLFLGVEGTRALLEHPPDPEHLRRPTNP